MRIWMRTITKRKKWISNWELNSVFKIKILFCTFYVLYMFDIMINHVLSNLIRLENIVLLFVKKLNIELPEPKIYL